MTKNKTTAVLVALGLAMSFAGAAGAQDTASYPNKTITIIVPFSPGASTDLVARYLAPKIKEALGQTVIVENKSGAGGLIGATYVAKAPPDGYTLLVASSTVHNSPLLKKVPPYDSTKDLAPIIAVLKHPFVLAENPKLPKTVPDLIAYAKKHPGELNFATLGGFNDLFCVMFNRAAGTKIELVHYRGAAENTIGVIRGDSHLVFNGYTFVKPQVDSGQIRILGVTSPKPSATVPGAPALAESGVPGFDIINLVGLLAPAGTPKPIIDKLNATIKRIINTPEAKEFIVTRSNDLIEDQSPEFYAKHIKDESDRVKRLIEEVGFEKT
jgi:tripartite-type tricarboxylate transporter receptor subunit TctC